MTERRRETTDVLGAVTFGFLLVVGGLIFITTPNLWESTLEFFRDFEARQIAQNIYLPVPKSDHPILYAAVERFCMAFAIFEIFVLAARFALRHSVDRVAGTVSSLVFWAGAYWIVGLLLRQTIGWILMLGYLLVLAGVSLVVQGLVTILGYSLSKT